jgi:PPOX class probable F420-dependent enzyme
MRVLLVAIVMVISMLSDNPRLTETLDRAHIGFMTAVDGSGQPQTSPIWFHRDGEDIIVYNRPTARRLVSIVSNPKVALSLRGDRFGHAGVSLEGIAVIDESLPPSTYLPGYVTKYAGDIADLGWTPESFAADYSVGLRTTVTRVRAFGLKKWNEAESG